MATQPATSTPVRERVIAPDLARGLALLGIAVANSVVQLYGRPLGPSYRPLEASAVDRVTDVLSALLVDNRGYPLFSFLLGYGVAQLSARLLASGMRVDRVRNLLARRGLALLALGAVHALLLFSGDILGLYGLLTLLLAIAATARTRSLLLGAVVSLVPFTVLGALDGLGTGTPATDAAAQADYLLSAGQRMAEWMVGLAAAPVLGVGLLAPMMLGMIAARRRLLDEPSAHPRLLAAIATGGVVVGVVGGVPLALTSTGAWDPTTPVDLAVGALHGLTGLAGALGYAAVAGLAVRALRSPGPLVAALVACGRRSLSSYLAQSVIMVPLMAPWGVGLGGRIGTAAAAGVAAAVWLVTVLWSVLLERSGRRGPAEVLLRRVVYGAHPTDRHGSARSAAT